MHMIPILVKKGSEVEILFNPEGLEWFEVLLSFTRSYLTNSHHYVVICKVDFL